MPEGRSKGRFLRLMSTAVVNQALLSLASLAVGLLLLRHSSDLQYGYYVLGSTALLLMTGLQTAFIGPPMVNRLTHAEAPQRAAIVGGLYREQRNALRLLAAAVVVLAGLLYLVRAIALPVALLVAVTAVVAVSTLNREFFRAVLLAHRRAPDVLRADAVYVAAMAALAALALLTPAPGVATILGLGCAALAGGKLLKRALRRHEPWDPQGSPGILREIAPVGAWSVLGSAIHWLFNQGYSYVIAGTLGVPAVAAVSATRLMMMPVNLISTGMASVMMPLAARWLHDRGAASLLRRLLLITAGLAAAAGCYFVLMWLLRDWIFGSILHKQFANRDLLLQLWVCVFVLVLCRDQMIWLLVVRERFRPLAGLTAASAVIALAASYLAMVRIGVAGALVGILAGEVVQVAGIIGLSLREMRRPAPRPGAAGA